VNQLHAAFVALGYKPGSLISLVRWMLRARTYDITAALAGALARERDEHERALSIAKLGPLDQIVLAAVAHVRSVFSRSALDEYGGSEGRSFAPARTRAAVQPVAAAPGHSYVGHVLEVTDQMVVQNSGGPSSAMTLRT
jgi:hypothetical protein